ncbi:hypothetical protein AAG570_000630 [Ranatra chinensis]|uniref:Sulfotransferase domain-containing protein n=1 Tax=Ranatra chinensis TaxID=642074 RepID=A0ABD0YXL5_9HEMI
MFPYSIEFLEETVNKDLMDHFRGEKTGFCQVGPQKWLLPAAYAAHAEKYYSMPIREDDVWIITYPRSGTTLCQELIWLLNNELDFKTSSEIKLNARFPFYEFAILNNEKLHNEIIELNSNNPDIVENLKQWRTPGYIKAEMMKSPRHLKTHLPFSLLPQNVGEACKAIYVARNPKDVAVSYYHHNRLIQLHGYNGDFKQYWKYFENDLLVFSPYWEHIKEGWERRNKPNILFLFYEDIIKDMPGAIKTVAKFLNKTISTDDIDALVNHLQIDNFKKSVPLAENVPMEGVFKKDEESFIRRGKIGGNKELTEDMMDGVEKWIEDNLNNTGIEFPIKF